MSDHDHDSDPADRLLDTVRDTCAVAIGLGVLALNRVQAVRRQVQRSQQATSAQEPTSDPADGRPPPR